MEMGGFRRKGEPRNLYKSISVLSCHDSSEKEFSSWRAVSLRHLLIIGRWNTTRQRKNDNRERVQIYFNRNREKNQHMTVSF